MNAKIDLLAIHTVGARLNPEKSHALRSKQYGDPANSVRFERETCFGCKYERIFIAGNKVDIGICQKKNADGSRRLYGTRCTDYRVVGSK